MGRAAGLEGEFGQQAQSETMDRGNVGLIEGQGIVHPAHIEQAGTDAPPQLGRRRFRKGHGHDASRVDEAVTDPVTEALLDRIGLPGTGAGRDEGQCRQPHGAASSASPGTVNRPISGLLSRA